MKINLLFLVTTMIKQCRAVISRLHSVTLRLRVALRFHFVISRLYSVTLRLCVALPFHAVIPRLHSVTLRLRVALRFHSVISRLHSVIPRLDRGISGIKIGLITLLITQSSFADNATASALLATKLNNINSMSADFNQVVYSDQGSVLQASAGTMKLLRPGRFYWETTTPNLQTMIANDELVIVINPELHQTMIRHLADVTNSLPMLLLNEDVSTILQSFTVTQPSDRVFELVPRDEESMVLKIYLQFDGKHLVRLDFVNYLEQPSKIVFSHIVNNKLIDASLFDIKDIAGNDVVRLGA